MSAVAAVTLSELPAEFVPTRLMFREKYARPLHLPSIREMVDHWDPILCDVLVVSLRSNGQYAILDGTHRHRAAIELHISELPARVLRGLSPIEESFYYVELNKHRRKLTPMDIYRGQVHAEDGEALDLLDTVRLAGFDIALDGKGSGRIDAITSLQNMQLALGCEGVLKVLNIIRDAWGITENRRAICANVLDGMTSFFLRYDRDPRFKRSRLLDRLKLVKPEGLLAESMTYRVTKRQGMSPGVATGRAIHDHFNAGLRTEQRLPPWPDRVVGEIGRQRVTEAARASNIRRAQQRAAERKD